MQEPPIKSLVLELLSIESTTDRRTLLDERCGADESLRKQVEKFIACEDRLDDFLDVAAQGHAEMVQNLQVVDPLIGAKVGPYKLREKLGEGGMGTVYIAEQRRPVRRKVALKIVKQGMDTQQVLARFEAERQALALMDHPNIAKVLDAGATDLGRPFFVMELVQGLPITDYCDDRQLSIRERLELFVRVCRAVQHAHQKGIIHRDLKPSNVLVARIDGEPVVKVIDFGVAKAVGQDLSDQSVYTQFSQMIGTPLYMSPEQAELGVVDVDTRSDVYSLGAMLYELLTGSTCLDRDALKRAGFDEMRRMIREQQPSKPSSRVSTLSAQARTTVADQRGRDSRRLSSVLKGELDWIVLKSLEKDRNRRYESPNAFAADIERYLQNKPVEASPPTISYRLRKYTARNRGVLTAMLLIAASLLAGTALSISLAIRAMNEAEDARAARDETQVALTKAKVATADAEESAFRAEAARAEADTAIEFIVDAFRRSDPARDGRDVRVVELLEDAVKTLNEQRFSPTTQARLLHTVGVTYSGLGLPYDAIELLERSRDLHEKSLGREHSDTLVTINDLAEAYLSAGRYPQAIELLEFLLQTHRVKSGDDDETKLIAMNNLGSAYAAARRPQEAILMHETAYTSLRRKLGAGHEATLTAMHNLSTMYRDDGRHAKAIQLCTETLNLQQELLGSDDLSTLRTMNTLAAMYHSAGQFDQAIQLGEKVVEARNEKLGLAHPDSLQSTLNLAESHKSAHHFDESTELFEEVLSIRKQIVKARSEKLGQRDPATLQAMYDLAEVNQALGNHHDSLRLHEETLELRRKILGANHRDTQISMEEASHQHFLLDQWPQGTLLLEELIKLQRESQRPVTPPTLLAMESLAQTYALTGKLKQAISVMQDAQRIKRDRFGATHTETVGTTALLAAWMHTDGDLPRAISAMEEIWFLIKEMPVEDRPASTPYFRSRLASLYDAAERYSSSELLHREQLAEARISGRAAKVADKLVVLGLNLVRQQKWTSAEELLGECVAMREKSSPDHWATFLAKSLLGECLLEGERYTEAEKQLLEGFHGLRMHEDRIQSDYKSFAVKDAHRRIVRLYELQGNQELVAKWIAEGDSLSRAESFQGDK